MTVRALLDLLNKGDAGEQAKVPLDRAPFTPASFNSPWRLWLNSERRGRSVYIYLPPTKSRADQFKAHLRVIQWRWHIVGLDLPGDLKQHLAEELKKLAEDRLRPESSP